MKRIKRFIIEVEKIKRTEGEEDIFNFKIKGIKETDLRLKKNDNIPSNVSINELLEQLKEVLK